MDRNKGLLRGIAAVLVCLMLVFAAPESFAAAGAAVEGLFARAETEQRMLEAEDPVYDIIGEDISKRDAFTKHYVLRDKSYVSVVSEEPVHYYANGAWQEIDPTLERREDGTLVNAAGAFEAVLGEDISGERAVTLAYGGYELSWRALGTLNGRKNAAAENYGQQKKQGKVKRSELAEKKVGAVRYQDTYANTDIEYQVAYNGLKENIIIRARQNKYEYSFIYRMGERLAMRTEESGGVAIYDRETAETVFAIPAPYMVDANGELSYDAYYTLKEQGKGQYRLTVTASADFIRSAALPVTLDPAIFIQRVTEQAAVRTSYLASGTNYASQTNLGADKKILYVGYEASAYKWCRTYIQTDLPKLTGSDIVTNAYIGLVQKQGRYNTVSAAEQAIGIAEVRRSWSPSTLTWNMQKSDSFGDFLDYQYVVRNERTSGSGTYFDIPMQWNVTAAVKRWYAQNELTACASGNSENFGFVLRMVNENLSGTSPASHAIYYNDRTVTNYAPYLVIEYRNNKGLESYWTYHGQSAGRAGVGQVNDYTGNLVFTHADASTSGSRMPVTLSHVYNSYDADVENAVIPCGKGWMLSIAQTVTPVADAGIAANYPYYYTDSDGTRHYFMKTSDNKLMDEDGLGYTLTVNTSGDVKYTVKDRSGNTMSFDGQGRLVKIADTAYNYASVAYSASAVTVTDGTGQSIVIALSGERVSSITTPDGKAVSYQYNAAGYLVSVTYPDGKSSYYTYAAAPAQADGAQNTRPLLSAQEPGGYAVHYEYTPDRARRVSRVYETGGGQLGQGMYVAYGEDASTTFTSAGVDGVFGTNDDILTVCQFDHFGHTVASYSRLKGSVDSVLSAQYYGFDTTDYSAYQAANNRLTSVASGNVGAANRVVQPGFESMNGVETYKEDNAIFVLNPSIKLQGQASASIFTSSETGGLALYKQTFALMHFRSSDRSYTASVYVYVPEGVTGSGGVVIGVCPANAALSESDYTVIPLSELAREQNGWSRISFTVTPQTSSDFECFHIYCGIKDLKGSACFDCLQFEQSSAPNAYSLIGLGSFDYNQNTTWTYSGLNPALGTPAASANATGSFDTVKSASQTVNISENGSFTLSGWASAPKAVPTGESAKKIKKAVYSSGKYAVSVEEEPFFGLKAVVTYTDNTTKEAACSFNTAVAGVQYASVSFDTENEGKTPKSITVTAEYAHQLGYVSFSNVQLTQGSFTAYEYNENGFLTSMKQDGNAAGNVTDAKGNVTSSTDINGQTTTYTYNAKNLLTASTLPTGVKSAYDYDSHGNLIASSVYGGNFAAYVGPSENVTYLIGNRADHRLFLDATGGGKAAIYTGKDEQLFTLEKCGDYWYIVAHNGQVLGLDGNTYPMPHVSLMDKVTEAGAQQDKQLFKVECLGGITKMYPKTQLNYQLGPNADYLIIAPMTTMNFAWELLPIAYGHPEAISTTQQYDSNGRFVASSTDERGNVTTYTYDQATGRLLSFTDSTGTTAYTYDPNTGELLSVSKGGAQVQYAYEDDRLSTITRNGFSYAFEYDAFGNNTKTKAGNTVLAENTYNTGAGLLQSTAYGNGDTASFGYDSYGRVISLSYGGTLTFSYTYDNAGRMLKSYDHRNGRTYSYHYDFKGRLAAKVCSDGTRLNYTYDNRDYLLSS
ncbi:MAG: RHS repeat protein, partial [Clostridiales bacterium]|nr:RHS repeat protein [Clostridiales bacterium]